jgi:hypothetical protein
LAEEHTQLVLMLEAHKGLDDIEAGRTTSLKEFKKRHGLR